MRILSGTGGYDKTGPGGEAGTGGWGLIKNAQRDAPSCNFYRTREGAEYTRLWSSLLSMYRPLGSLPNSSILVI